MIDYFYFLSYNIGYNTLREAISEMSNNKKQWKYNPIAKDLGTPKYRQRIKRPRSPYDDDQFDIYDELNEYYKEKEKERNEDA